MVSFGCFCVCRCFACGFLVGAILHNTTQLLRRLTISVFERSVDLDNRVLRQPRFGGIGVCKRENQRVPKNTHTVENRFRLYFTHADGLVAGLEILRNCDTSITILRILR